MIKFQKGNDNTVILPGDPNQIEKPTQPNEQTLEHVSNAQPISTADVDGINPIADIEPLDYGWPDPQTDTDEKDKSENPLDFFGGALTLSFLISAIATALTSGSLGFGASILKLILYTGVGTPVLTLLGEMFDTSGKKE